MKEKKKNVKVKEIIKEYKKEPNFFKVIISKRNKYLIMNKNDSSLNRDKNNIR